MTKTACGFSSTDVFLSLIPSNPSFLPPQSAPSSLLEKDRSHPIQEEKKGESIYEKISPQSQSLGKCSLMSALPIVFQTTSNPFFLSWWSDCFALFGRNKNIDQMKFEWREKGRSVRGEAGFLKSGNRSVTPLIFALPPNSNFEGTLPA